MWDITGAITDAISIVKLDDKATKKVSKDANNLKLGLLIILIGGMLTALYMNTQYENTVKMLESAGLSEFAQSFEKPNNSSLLTSPIWTIIGQFIWVAILFGIVMIFRGKGTYMEHFRVFAYASILSWANILGIIPFFGGLVMAIASIWWIVVIISVVAKVNNFSKKKAALIILIPLILVALFIVLLLSFAFIVAFSV